MAARRALIAGNWKMNGLAADAAALVDVLTARIGEPRCEVVVCPPATLLAAISDRCRGTPVATGAQDCHAAAKGAHTGDLAAEMIADAGGRFVIVGHSERRADHGETDDAVRAKAAAAWRAGLTAIVCVGETEAERDDGRTLAVVGGQVAGSIPDGATPADTVVAYEPVWAIGTGRTPTLDDVAEVHKAIRRDLAARFGDDGFRILYGGSMKPDNARGLLALDDVDGGLVGGASLDAASFAEIIDSCP